MDTLTPFEWFMLGWIVLALIVSIALFFVPAPYGKFARRGFGPRVNRIVGWIVMETPAAWLLVIIFALSEHVSHPGAMVSLVFVVLWQIHYLYRTYLFPFTMRGDRANITLLTVVLGVVFNFGNGFINGYYLFEIRDPLPADWLTDWRFLIGVSLFFIGLGTNIHSDTILRSLRRPGDAQYRIPNGGLFNYISQANYFGELIEWAGWALLTWSPAGLTFFIWTASNLIPRAWSNHRWYRRTFPDYPSHRKAIIPFIF